MLQRFKLAMQGCGADGPARVCSGIAKQINEGKLQVTFTWHTASGDEHQRFVQRGPFHAGIQNDSGDLNNVAGQLAMADRILRYEFEQGWIPKVVSAFEYDALLRQIGMPLQVGAQTLGVAGIEKLHGAPECGVFNALMVGQIELIRERRFFNMPLQPRPARKASLASDGELRVAEA